MEKVDAIFFIGPQGSGKGTQARKLAEKLDFFYWEMGGIVRETASLATDLGRKVKELQDQGVLLPDALLLEIFKSRMSELPTDRGVVFDGVPRRIGQAEFVIETLHNQGRTRFLTLFIDLPREESIQRLLKRAEVEKRVDDTREGIEKRLGFYENDTIPVLDFMKQRGQFITIDGSPSIEDVTHTINRELGIE